MEKRDILIEWWKINDPYMENLMYFDEFKSYAHLYETELYDYVRIHSGENDGVASIDPLQIINLSEKGLLVLKLLGYRNVLKNYYNGNIEAYERDCDEFGKNIDKTYQKMIIDETMRRR